MGMLGTLAKVAIGIAVAKGVGSVLKGGKGGGGILGGGNVPAGGTQPQSGGGLQDIMGDILSGGQRGGQAGGQAGGLGDLLEKLGGALGQPGGQSGGRAGSPTGGSGGGLGDLLGGLTGAQTRGGGSLGEVFGDFLQQRQQAPNGGSGSGGSFGDIFNEALANGGEPETAATDEQEIAAALMLRAMIQAAKSDGQIDDAEQRKLLENLQDATPQERDFVNQELSAPVDVAGLAAQVPHGLENQVYLMALMGIDLDNRKEAEFLHELATGLEIDRDMVNSIHDQLGTVRLYR